MKKVVAFLEEYAEWLALGVACLFLLYMVWSYVISPEPLKVAVGGEKQMPGDVDTYVSSHAVNRLQDAMNAPADVKIPVPDFDKEFATAMGPNRPHMAKEFLAVNVPFRPLAPGVEYVKAAPSGEDHKFVMDIKVPTPVWDVKFSAQGNSLVMPPPPPPEGENPDDPQQQAAAAPPPIQPPVQGGTPEENAVLLANALDKYWITVEAKLPMKGLVDEWKRVFYDPKTKRPWPNVPQEGIPTSFMQVEVEREEQVGPNQWGNKVTLKPLPLVHAENYPKEGDRVQEERYRAWAEQRQVDVVEPAFYQIIKGDPWYVPSLGAPKDQNQLAAEAANQQPFDPANPPNRTLTTWEKQQVYIYKQKVREEQQKQEAVQRKAKLDSTRSGTGSEGSGSRGGGGGRRSIGGYAPLPIELASGQGISDDGGGYGRRRGPAQQQPGQVPPMTPGARGGGFDRGGYAPGYNPRDLRYRNTPDRSGEYRRRSLDASTPPAIDPSTGFTPSAALAGPFDPTRLPVDIKGNVPDVIMWAHDDTAVPGKNYRYRLRVKIKNPLYATFGLAKDQKDAETFALMSDWTPWKEIRAPRSTDYFFATYRAQLQAGTILSVNVDVFKRQKGEWSMATFTVAPGDAIGGVKNGVDYATGKTLVDLRRDVRDKDVKIMVADEVGTIDTVDFQDQVNDDWYKSLKEKISNAQALLQGAQDGANGGGNGAVPAGGTGPSSALINEVGARRARGVRD
ncbi:MAG TPA: hypothetical protein VH475_17715 [Tepidisphaeraceae bacterium]|jgi:hypothetical protein